MKPILLAPEFSHGLGREPTIALHKSNVRFLRNKNHFPDSGHTHAAMHEAGVDPKETYTSTVNDQAYRSQWSAAELLSEFGVSLADRLD